MNKHTTTLNRNFLFKLQKAASSFEDFTWSLFKSVTSSTGSYKLRKIKASDDPKVRELIQKILLERGGLGIESLYYENELVSISDHYRTANAQFYVLTLDDEVVGTVGIGPTEDHTACQIKKLYLHRDCRNKGLGKMLFSKALKEAFLMGYQSCEVSIEMRNQQFHSFLLNNGFAEMDKATENPYEVQLCKSLN